MEVVPPLYWEHSIFSWGHWTFSWGRCTCREDVAPFHWWWYVSLRLWDVALYDDGAPWCDVWASWWWYGTFWWDLTPLGGMRHLLEMKCYTLSWKRFTFEPLLIILEWAVPFMRPHLPHMWDLEHFYVGQFDVWATLLRLGGIIGGLRDLSTHVSWIFYVMLPYL